MLLAKDVNIQEYLINITVYLKQSLLVEGKDASKSCKIRVYALDEIVG